MGSRRNETPVGLVFGLLDKRCNRLFQCQLGWVEERKPGIDHRSMSFMTKADLGLESGTCELFFFMPLYVCFVFLCLFAFLFVFNKTSLLKILILSSLREGEKILFHTRTRIKSKFLMSQLLLSSVVSGLVPSHLLNSFSVLFLSSVLHSCCATYSPQK